MTTLPTVSKIGKKALFAIASEGEITYEQMTRRHGVTGACLDKLIEQKLIQCVFVYGEGETYYHLTSLGKQYMSRN